MNKTKLFAGLSAFSACAMAISAGAQVAPAPAADTDGDDAA